MANYYSEGKIIIPNVTGNIVITASAVSSVQETLPVTWVSGKKAAYTVGSAFTLTDDSAYIVSEEIPVEYGRIYSFEWNCLSSNSMFYYVGVDANNIVTEVEKVFPERPELVNCEWTPTVETTVGLRLRGYTDNNMTEITELKVN